MRTQLLEERIVIVDFDNLHRSLRQRGLFRVLWRILEQLIDPSVPRQHRYTVRLYGGWYQGNRLTRNAQDLAIEIDNDIPRIFHLVLEGCQCRIPLSVELAYSLAALPSKHLLATYRPRSVQNTIQCREPRALGCSIPSCPMSSVHAYFRDQACPDVQCSMPCQEFVFRGEQKLVDTMMLSDLIHYSIAGHRELAVVSSDDDLWPGILSALQYGASIRHIRTSPIPLDRYGYMTNLPASYRTSSLS